MADPTTSTPPNTYVPGYAPAHIKNHTWRTAENSAAYLLPTLDSMARTNPTLSLLDVGAGPGTISASLAKHIPDGTVTATDLSPEVLARAEHHAAAEGVTNMTFQPADVYALPFEDARFDVVHAQQVLCHLASPARAVSEMLRVLAPGGVLALRESDMRMWTFHPDLPALREFNEMLRSTMASPNVGAELVSLALAAGMARSNVTASMGTWCYSTAAEREMWGGVMRDRVRAGGMREKALGAGRGWTEGDLERMAEAWEAWIAAEDGCFGCMHGEVLVRK